MNRALALSLLVGLGICALSSTVSGTPQSLTHQGRLLDSDGAPVSGTRALTFSIYDDMTGGTLLWSESHAAVTVTDGLFSVELGSTTPISADLLATPLYSGLPPSSRCLEIQVDGEILTPRTRLSSAPYSLVTERLSGDVETAPGSVSIGDLDGDGIPDLLLVSDLSSARLAIKTKGTGAIPGRVASSVTSADGESTLEVHEIDNDGDGNPEFSAGTMVTADSARQWLDDDSDDDGVSDADAEMVVMPGTAWVAIKTKGTGADKNRVIGTADDTSAVVITESDSASIAMRTKGGGVIKGAINVNHANRSTVDLHVEDESSSMSTGVDINHDGSPDIVIAQACTVDSAFTETSYFLPDAASPTYILKAKERANKTKCSNDLRQFNTTSGRSASSEVSCDTASVVMIDFASSSPSDGTALYNQSCTVDSVSREVTYAFPDATFPTVLSKVKEKANKSVCRNNLSQLRSTSETEAETSCDSTSAASTWRADDFSGSLISVAIRASTDPLVNPIEHSSGAHLTPGGVWTNASDETLKENFEVVDGAALLDKLESLDIMEWNYKSESDDIRHIGPTAQDFQQTFGVGSDGTSISTIDPSGIALAAIKALHEKSKRVDELEKKVDELSRIIDQLVKSDK